MKQQAQPSALSIRHVTHIPDRKHRHTRHNPTRPRTEPHGTAHGRAKPVRQTGAHGYDQRRNQNLIHTVTKNTRHRNIRPNPRRDQTRMPGTRTLSRHRNDFCGQNSARRRRNHLETIGPGDYRDRTDDPLLAKQVLSQLS
jgi:hypothetical protein